MAQSNQPCRMATRRGVGRQQPDQHHRRACEREERQLHGRIFPPRGTPDRDQEVLGHNRDFVEDEEQKQVEAEKDSVNTAYEREEECKELMGAQFDVPTEQDAGHRGQPGQQHQHAANAVGSEQEVNPHRRDPGHIDNHHAALPHAGHKPRHGQRQPGHSHRKRQPAGQSRSPFRQQRQQQRSGKREIDRPR